jgi:3-oxoadipate enol-lactonase
MVAKVSINSVDLAYDDHGIGMPMIFLHAFPLNRSMWAGQIDALRDEGRFRLVAPDWRGFGDSSLPHTVTTMESLADDLAGLMDALGMPQAIFCGLSMGGYVAFAFYRKYAQRVSGLILADTRPDADTTEAQANREKLAQLVEQQGTEAVADLQLPRLLSAYTHEQHPWIDMRVRQMISITRPSAIAAASRGMALREDSTSVLSQITCPTLVLVGEQDVLTPPDVARQYATQIMGAQLAVIPHSGHLSVLEQPEVFHGLVHNFLLANF